MVCKSSTVPAAVISAKRLTIFATAQFFEWEGVKQGVSQKTCLSCFDFTDCGEWSEIDSPFFIEFLSYK